MRTEIPRETESPTRELRLALAMRGGVSLAIWIGGACAEVEALRLSAGGDNATEFYRELLSSAGFDAVTVDIVSGASAGGLNGALLATSLMYGVDFASLKKLWLDIADLQALTRDPAEADPPSVLKGDEYFLTELSKALKSSIKNALRSHDPGQGHSRTLDLFLATTLMKPVKVLVYGDWATRYHEKTQRALFHFRHNEFTSDMELDGSEGSVDAIAERLALAARASSSFPGAFEPATVFASRLDEIGKRAGADDSKNLFGIFSVVPETGKAYVMDGGVLDNIPVERAIRATAEASADGPTERWMVFLHPSPEPTDGDDDGAEERPAAAASALSALTTAASSESLLDDIAVLADHNEAASRYHEMYVAELDHLAKEGTAGTILEATRRYEQYLRLRAWFSAARIIELLEDPVSVLDEDPFTSSQQTRPLFSSPDEGWTTGARIRLEEEIRNDFADPPPWPQDAPLTQDIDEIHQLGIPALVRALDSVIVVSKKLEGRVGGGDAFSEVCALKEKLYSLRTVAALLSHLSDLFWPVYASVKPVPKDPESWVRDAIRAREEFTRTWLGSDDDVESSLLPTKLRGLFAHLRAELHRRLAVLQDHTWNQDDHTQTGVLPEGDIVKDLWIRLVGCTSELSEMCSMANVRADPEDISDEGGGDAHLRIFLDALAWLENPGDLGDWVAGFLGKVVEDSWDELANCLAGVQMTPVPATRGERAVQLLAAFEVLSFPLTMTALSGRQNIRFLRIAGSNRTPLEGLFPGGRLEQADKLAGNEVKNFSAFYAKSWRANDWMWGRVDAATSLIEMLLRGSIMKPHFQGAGDFVAFVKRLVKAPPPASVGDYAADWESHFESLWEQYGGAVVDESERLYGDGGEGTELTYTKEVLVARRHWDLLIDGLPDVVDAAAGEELAEGVSPTWRPTAWTAGQRRRIKSETLMQGVFAAKASNGPDPLKNPQGMMKLLGKYKVGRETIAGDAGSDRFTVTVANLAVVAWKSFTKGLPPKSVISVAGMVLRIMRVVALTVVKAPPWGAWLLGTVLVLSTFVWVRDNPVWIFNRNVAAASVAGALFLIFYFASDLARKTMLVALVLIGGGALWLARNTHADFRFGLGKEDSIDVSLDALQVVVAAVVVVFAGYVIGRGVRWVATRIITFLRRSIQVWKRRRGSTTKPEGPGVEGD
jgi:patatin-related protein